MHPADIAIIVLYLLAMPVIGLLLRGKQRTGTDFFVGGRTLPWWAVCLSVVATETSTLTVISTPGLVWGSGFTYLQLALGYIAGRTIVSVVLLPRYFKGNFVTAYTFLGKRFGTASQTVASLAFVVTRLLAEGVRLFAGAIPIQAILATYGLHTQYWHIVLGLTVLTVVYTYVGGVRSVVWVDVVQLALYLGGAIVAVVVLADKLPSNWMSIAADGGRYQFLDFSSPVLTSQYAFVTAVVGGAVFSMASHGSDQLIVQRLLATRSLRDGQKALIGSGIVVFVQFGLFLLVGSGLWVLYHGAAPKELGLQNTDGFFAKFIVESLPVGVAGLLIAGILASTMGALASALNALSTSTVNDLYQRLRRQALPEDAQLRHGRMWTLVWAAVFVVFASMFSTTTGPVIELGLSITGYTYGALLGSFALGLLVRRARELDAVLAFLITIAVMAVVVSLKFTVNGKQVGLAFPWYTLLGVVITLIVGGLMSLRHRTAAPELVEADLP
ncbi:MAG: sodium:solute symporter [Kutzneria sp.]|nr:sodium:solute symporter [Kutzneria sp.]